MQIDHEMKDCITLCFLLNRLEQNNNQKTPLTQTLLFHIQYILQKRTKNKKPDICRICQRKFTDKCIQCYHRKPNLDLCSITLGSCGHMFHTHCIEKWLSVGKHLCPIKIPYLHSWQYKLYES